jgi:hypothetical protein
MNRKRISLIKEIIPIIHFHVIKSLGDRMNEGFSPKERSPTSGPLRGTAGLGCFLEYLVTYPPWGSPFGGGGVYRIWKQTHPFDKSEYDFMGNVLRVSQNLKKIIDCRLFPDTTYCNQEPAHYHNSGTRCEWGKRGIGSFCCNRCRCKGTKISSW